MAVKPKSYCGKCRKVHAKDLCPHRQAFGRKRKPQRSGRGGRAWQTLRRTVFERDSFLCQIHLEKGQLVSVDLHGPNHGVCDHIIAISQGGADIQQGDEINPDDYQTICQSCDKGKTYRESRGENLPPGVAKVQK